MTATTATTIAAAPSASLAILCRALKIPTVARHAEEVARLAERESWTFERYLHHLVELEVHERRRRRTERYVALGPAPPALVDLELDEVMQVPLERPALAFGEASDLLGVACHGGDLERTTQDRERCRGRRRDRRRGRRGHAATSCSSASYAVRSTGGETSDGTSTLVGVSAITSFTASTVMVLPAI